MDRLTTRTISVPAEDCEILDWLDEKVRQGEGNFSEVIRKYLRKCMEAESGTSKDSDSYPAENLPA